MQTRKLTLAQAYHRVKNPIGLVVSHGEPDGPPPNYTQERPRGCWAAADEILQVSPSAAVIPVPRAGRQGRKVSLQRERVPFWATGGKSRGKKGGSNNKRQNTLDFSNPVGNNPATCSPGLCSHFPH